MCEVLTTTIIKDNEQNDFKVFPFQKSNDTKVYPVECDSPRTLCPDFIPACMSSCDPRYLQHFAGDCTWVDFSMTETEYIVNQAPSDSGHGLSAYG